MAPALRPPLPLAAAPRPRLLCFALLAAMQLSLVSASPIYSAAPVELQPSVLVLGVFDWETYDTGSGSRCQDMVKRAAGLGISRVNFVITASARLR